MPNFWGESKATERTRKYSASNEDRNAQAGPQPLSSRLEKRISSSMTLAPPVTPVTVIPPGLLLSQGALLPLRPPPLDGLQLGSLLSVFLLSPLVQDRN